MAADHIQYFNGQYRFLSNFFIEPDLTHVEGEYQSCKCEPPAIHLRRKSPRQAKIEGRYLILRADWNQVRIEFMYQLVLRKFRDHPTLLEALKRTGGAYLEEGNTWGDTFWGTVDGIGHNHLGRILMKVREELA